MISDKFWFYWAAFSIIILLRYLLVAGGIYCLFYSKLAKPLVKRSLRQRPVQWQMVRQDIQLSLLSTAVFALCATLIMVAYDAHMTLLYVHPAQYHWWYLGASFAAVLLLQDAYFYFIHRLFHHPLLFKWLHQGHHQSGCPTPWTSFAFDPPEAIVQGIFFVAIVFMIPLNFITLITAMLTMTLWSVFTHLGLEISCFPWTDRYTKPYLIGPVHHALHHRKYSVHYGLYFTFWDKLLGTHTPTDETNLESLSP